MSALGWIVLVGYVIVGLIAARLIAGQVAYEFDGTPGDWLLGGMLGLLVGCVWPAAVACWLVKLIPIQSASERRAREIERKRQASARAYEVQRLERELEIGP